MNKSLFCVSETPSLKILNAHNATGCQLLELNDGTLISSSMETRFWRWSRNGQRLCVYMGHSDIVWNVVEVNGEILASVSRDETMRLWNKVEGCCVRSLPFASGVNSQRGCILKLRCEDELMAGCGGFLTTWRAKDLRHIQSFISTSPFRTTSKTLELSCLTELSNGTIAAGYEAGILIWNLRKLTIGATLLGHTDLVSQMIELKSSQSSPSRVVLASASFDCTIRLWAIEYKQQLPQQQTGSISRRQRSTHSLSASCLFAFGGHLSPIQTLIELPDGTIATGSNDKAIRLFSSRGDLLDEILTRTTVHRMTQLRDGSVAALEDQSITIRRTCLNRNTLIHCCCYAIAKTSTSFRELHMLQNTLPLELMKICVAFYDVLLQQQPDYKSNY
eukprot:TRINITY_DN3777_c0_g2_i1.p1 TRINITY_DN3777_c0_g2~~TRINITY_DN3777_c0_g2_i1.p1  ORF type:complete len:390 (-),score=29.56 TRINITY_DN3777_c0_g2_i1:75-1244(-)